nr:DinB family protein [Allomuricauda sp.]
MDVPEIIAALECNAKVFAETLSGIPAAMVTWKSNPKDWSPLEIICHLVDEETDDFRARVKHALETPDKALVPIDPVGWITQHDYAKQDVHERLSTFLKERKKSIIWLRNLKNPNWNNAIDHPERGKITAASFLANWLSHDYHHIRQINNLKHAYLMEKSGDSLSYAGKW